MTTVAVDMRRSQALGNGNEWAGNAVISLAPVCMYNIHICNINIEFGPLICFTAALICIQMQNRAFDRP